MSIKHYFTVAQANAMVPQLERYFERVFRITQQMDEALERVEDMGESFDENSSCHELFEFSGENDDPQTLDDLLNVKLFSEALNQQIQQIQDLGCVIKDLRKGLVDWYALEQNREIFLCWHFGEKSVNYWHEINGGFKNRRHVQELLSAKVSN
jgi:hypothetical protein